MGRLGAAAPGLGQFGRYQRHWLRADVVAGVTVAAYLIPQVMAYATLAGLPAVAGLWAAVFPLGLYAVFGTSRRLSPGPESSTAVMTAAVLAPVAAGDPARYGALAAVLAMLVGGICVTAGVLRLGVLANLLSRPVLIGYMSGIAVVMTIGQLGRITRVPASGEDILAQVRSFAVGAGQTHWPTLALAVAVGVVLWTLGRWAPHAPGPLIGVLAASLAVAVFAWQTDGIDVVGPLPGGVPGLDLTDVSVMQVLALIVPAVGIALVGFSDNVLTAEAFASPSGEEIDANAELRALGVCNAAAGLAGGFPVSSSGSRTAVAEAAGARTQVYSLVVLVSVLAVMFVGRGVLSSFPSAALGALVIYAATRLVDVPAFRRLAHFRRSELILALTTAAAVVGLGVLNGVAAAVALSILDLLRRMAHAHDSVLGFVPGVAGMHDVDDYPQARPVPGLLVYRYDAPLCFANATDFRRRALSAVDHHDGPVEWFVLNAEANVEIDLTAIEALDRLHTELRRRGIVFAMARVKRELRESLAAAGLLAKIDQSRIFMTLPTAVDAFRQRSPRADEQPVIAEQQRQHPSATSDPHHQKPS